MKKDVADVSLAINGAFGRGSWFQGPVSVALMVVVMVVVIIMRSKSQKGVLGRAPVVILRAIACTHFGLVPWVFFEGGSDPYATAVV